VKKIWTTYEDDSNSKNTDWKEELRGEGAEAGNASPHSGTSQEGAQQ
jgi:hypothetical protein